MCQQSIRLPSKGTKRGIKRYSSKATLKGSKIVFALDLLHEKPLYQTYLNCRRFLIYFITNFFYSFLIGNIILSSTDPLCVIVLHAEIFADCHYNIFHSQSSTPTQ